MMTSSPIRVWNETLLKFMRGIINNDDADRDRRSTGEAARIYALLNVAMHDAVAIVAPDPDIGFEPCWIKKEPYDSTGVSESLAAAHTGHALLHALFADPQRGMIINHTLSELVGAADCGGSASSSAGAKFGRAVADALLADKRFVRPPADPEDSPHFRPGAGRFGSSWGSAHRKMTPVVMESASQFRAPPPPDLFSEEYARGYIEVQSVGAREFRMNGGGSSSETALARLWNGGPRTAQESGHWLEVALVVLKSRAALEPPLSLREEVRVTCGVALAICDAMISSWDSKYIYCYWRPETAIRDDRNDLNPYTRSDPNWEPLHSSKGGSPEYTSGTATFGGAASTVLAAFFGNDTTFTVDFQRDTPGSPGSGLPEPQVPQTFRSLSEAAEAATRGRIYNGIHFAPAGKEGLKAGRAIGELVVKKMCITRLPEPVEAIPCKSIQDILDSTETPKNVAAASTAQQLTLPE